MKQSSTSLENAKHPTYIVKLISSTDGKTSYPAKVGVTFPTQKGNQRLVWEVIPATSELRNGTLILVPHTAT